jgi:hypothetical protein
MNRAGERMADVSVQALAAPAFYLELALGALAPGEYLIELASGAARELIPLKVGA